MPEKREILNHAVRRKHNPVDSQMTDIFRTNSALAVLD